MTNSLMKLAAVATAVIVTVGCQSKPKTGLDIWPQINSVVKTDSKIEQRIASILGGMTLEQKVAQMIQPEIRDISIEDMRKYGFGSFLNGGGAFPDNNKHATPADWIRLAQSMYQASIDDSLDGSTIPTMWGTDAVHGHNNVIGATLFPHNIGLGAANDAALIEQIAAATAKEVLATGIDWVFAPTVAVVRDDRWGRTYEGYSEDPQIVKDYAYAIVSGLQGSGDEFMSQQRVISTVKHFLGDGGTVGGDDQGDNIVDENQLFDIHAQGYVGGLSAGAQTVMVSFNSWHGNKNHGNKYLLTDVLKTKMGFDGLVVGDWNGHGQIKGCTNESCPQTINAGLDIFMVPTQSWKPLYFNTIEQVKQGIISQARIDDAVSRILRVKLRAGIFDKPSPANRALSGQLKLIGAPEHQALARQAVRGSLVLLKNNQQLLPLSPAQNILLAGDGADNIGKQAGGWTITWQGTGNNNADFPNGQSIYAGIKEVVDAAGGTVQLNVNGEYQQKPDVAVVVFGEDPYAEGNGDLDNLEYQRGTKKDLALLKKLRGEGIKVVSVFISGRPMWVNAELNASDAFVAAWLPGSQGAGVADVLIAKADGSVNHDFKGKLSFSWPSSPSQTAVNRFDEDKPLLPYGYGLSYDPNDNQGVTLANNLNEVSDVQMEQSQDMAIFNGTVKAPWSLYIADQHQRKIVSSNSQGNDVVQLRTIDKLVQEDARQLTFNGKGEGRVELSSNFTEDLRAYYQSQSSLSLQLKIDALPTEAVYLAIGCETGCDTSVDISTALAGLAPDSWHTISVDLACFDVDAQRMSKMTAAMKLHTKGAFGFSFADISFRPNSAKQATISCQ